MGAINKMKYNKHPGIYTIDHFTCDDCPAKLFNNGDKIIYKGIGNINSRTMIILPYYISINKKKFTEIIDIIVEEYKKRYRRDLFESNYITPVIKCFCDNVQYDIKNTVFSKCAIKTISELSIHKYHSVIIFLGDSSEIDIMIPNNLHKININCPFTIFDNDADKQIFLDELFKYI